MDVKRGSIVLFGSRVGISVVGFAATVYFARTLGQAALGIYFTFEAVINVLGLLSRFGITTAVEKRISEAATRNDEYLTGALTLATLPLVVVICAAVLLSGQIDAYVGAAATLALVAGLVSTNYSSVLLAALRAEGRVAESATLELAAEAVRVVVSFTLLFEGVGVSSLIYGFVAGMAMRAILAGVVLNAGLDVPSRETFVSLASFSRYTIVSNVSGLAYSWLDTLLLSYLLTKSVVGVYESAWKISVVALMASTALGTALFPAFSRWFSEGRVEYIEDAITEALTFTLVLVVPATVGAFLLGGDIMRIVYHFSTGGAVLAVLVGEKLFQGTVEVLQRALLGIDEARSVFYINVSTLATNVVLNVALISSMGAIGAAVATMTCSFVGLGLTTWRLHPHLSIRPNWRALSWEVVAALVMGGAIVALDHIVQPASLPTLLFVVAAGAGIYGGLVLLNADIRSSVRSLAS